MDPGWQVPAHVPDASQTKSQAEPNACQAPLGSHSSGWRPLHCFDPGLQSPLVPGSGTPAAPASPTGPASSPLPLTPPAAPLPAWTTFAPPCPACVEPAVLPVPPSSGLAPNLRSLCPQANIPTSQGTNTSVAA